MFAIFTAKWLMGPLLSNILAFYVFNLFTFTSLLVFCVKIHLKGVHFFATKTTRENLPRRLSASN